MTGFLILKFAQAVASNPFFDTIGITNLDPSSLGGHDTCLRPLIALANFNLRANLVPRNLFVLRLNCWRKNEADANPKSEDAVCHEST